MENIKLFATTAFKKTFENSPDYLEPYVSLDDETNKVSYNTESIIKITVREGQTVDLVNDVTLHEGVNLINTKKTIFDIVNGKQNIEELDYSEYRGYEIRNTQFAEYSFSNINLSPSIKTIGDDAFRECNSLFTANLSSVSSIGNEAFFMCSNLNKIILGDASILSVGTNAFFMCNNLNNIIINSQFAMKTVLLVIQAISAVQNIYVPQNLIQEYKTAPGWERYASMIKPIEE